MAPGPPPHLLPDFDPQKAKIPELRSILLQENVPYNGAAKKGDLVDLYELHVRPKAPKLLAEWARVRPSAHGILDGESSGSSLAELDTDSGEEADTALPVHSRRGHDGKVVKPKGAPRKSKVASKQKEEEDDVGEATPRKVPRKSSAPPADVPTASKPAATHKRRLGSTAPEEEEPKRSKPDHPSTLEKDRRVSLKYESGNESPFSDYNPFQSGNEESPDGKPKRRKSSMGPARRQSHLLASDVAGPSGFRKSMPATLPSAVSSSNRTASSPPPIPFPSTNTSVKKVGFWHDEDEPLVNSSPAVQARLVNRPTPTVVVPPPAPGTPGYKYMVPVEKVKQSPPDMQRRLAEFARARDERERKEKEEEEKRVAEAEAVRAEEETIRKREQAEREMESMVNLDDDEVDELEEDDVEDDGARGMDTSIFDGEDVMDLDDLERELDAGLHAQQPMFKSSPGPSASGNGLRWQTTPSKDVVDGFRTHLRKTSAPSISTPTRSVGTGRKSLGSVPSSPSTAGHVIRINAATFSPTSRRSTLVPLFIFLFTYLLWWREEKVATGFCDTSSSSNALVHSRFASHTTSLAADWLPPLPPKGQEILDSMHLRPSCTACPTHGICRDGSFVGCTAEYVAQRHWAELGGLVPVAPKCVPDTEKLLAVAVQASRAAKILKRERGRIICEGLEKIRRKKAKSEVVVWGLKAGEVLKRLAEMNEMTREPCSEDVLDDISRLALVDLQNHGDAISATEDGELWLASKTAEMPLSCRIRRTAVEHADKHKSEIASILAALSAILWLRSQLRSRKVEGQKVKDLVKTALQHLQRQERLHYTDPVITPTPHVAPSHLRDLVLQSEHSPVRRQQLWKKVEKVVESNANVRTTQVEIEGEPIRAWLWSGIAASEDGKSVEGVYPSLLK